MAIKFKKPRHVEKEDVDYPLGQNPHFKRLREAIREVMLEQSVLESDTLELCDVEEVRNNFSFVE